MQTIQIDIPDTLNDFLQKQATQKGFSSPREYLQSLLMEMQQRDANRADLERRIREGLRSPAIEADEAFWAVLKAEFLADHPEIGRCEQ